VERLGACGSSPHRSSSSLLSLVIVVLDLDRLVVGSFGALPVGSLLSGGIAFLFYISSGFSASLSYSLQVLAIQLSRSLKQLQRTAKIWVFFEFFGFLSVSRYPLAHSREAWNEESCRV
jgi:hypothetical protein